MTATPFDRPGDFLNAQNLLFSPYKQTQVSNSVRNYVDGQQQFLRQHARDGAALLEQWKHDDVIEASMNSPVAVSNVLETSERAMLNSSPLLVARVPVAIEPPEPAVDPTNTTSPNRIITQSAPSSKKNPKPRPKLQIKTDRPAILDEYDARLSPSFDRFSKDGMENQSTGLNTWLLQGLADRRERRRTKRAILNPAVEPTPSPDKSRSSSPIDHVARSTVSSSSPKKATMKVPPKKKGLSVAAPRNTKDHWKEVPPSETSGKENGKTRSEPSPRKGKTKRAKIAPGVALMQNFQAKNIPKGHRITVRTHNLYLSFVSLRYIGLKFCSQGCSKNRCVQQGYGISSYPSRGETLV